MKQTFIIIATLFLFILTLVLGRYFNAVSQQERIQQTQVYVFPMDKTFILPQEVSKLMPINDSVYKQIDIAAIEKQLEQNAYIDNAEVYKDLNGRLTAEISQYKPIARVIGNKSYYIDYQGNKKPLSDHYTENVILIFGDINSNIKKQLINLIHQIESDPNLKQIISEVHINDKQVVIKTDQLSADISIDILQNIDKQLDKLKAIYSYLVKTNKTNQYQKIDLRFKNQAVCKK